MRPFLILSLVLSFSLGNALAQQPKFTGQSPFERTPTVTKKRNYTAEMLNQVRPWRLHETVEELFDKGPQQCLAPNVRGAEKRMDTCRGEALKGNPYAQYLMAYFLSRSDLLDDKKFIDEMVDWFTKAGNNGVPYALYQAGNIYRYGYYGRLEPNKEKMLALYQQAGDKGYVPGYVTIADMYYQGTKLIKQDYKEAKKWYQKAAEKSDPVAEFFLGEIASFKYVEESGDKEPLLVAKKWYEKSANAGYGKAQYKLGMLLYSIQRDKEDIKNAYKWFQIAAIHSDYSQAVWSYQMLTLALTEEERNDIIEVAKAWKPTGVSEKHSEHKAEHKTEK